MNLPLNYDANEAEKLRLTICEKFRENEMVAVEDEPKNDAILRDDANPSKPNPEAMSGGRNF